MNIELIEWLDHHFNEQGWKNIKKLNPEDDELHPVVSVGFVVSENKDYITLAHSKSDDFVGKGITIGKRLMTKRVVLRKNVKA